MNRPRKASALVALLLSSLAVAAVPVSAADAPLQVLYVTHLPGRYHDYQAQMEEFQKHLPKFAHEVDVTYQAGSLDDMLAFLKKPGYAEGYDVLVYNFCVAHNKDLELADNIIAQTRERGVPAVLVHCAMHCFWASFGQPGTREAANIETARKDWKAKHPDRPFPDWSTLSGLDTKRHDKQRALTLRKAEPVHPVVAFLPEEWKIVKDELYQNVAFHPGGRPALVAYSVQSKKDHVIAWESPCGKGRVFGITIGHGMETFRDQHFHHVLTNAVLYLGGRLPDPVAVSRE